MSKSILAALGEDALFDGATDPERVNIEHGVQLSGIDGERAEYRGDLVVNRDVATVEHWHQAGEYFVQNGKRYRLEFLVQDNGANKRFTIMEFPVGP